MTGLNVIVSGTVTSRMKVNGSMVRFIFFYKFSPKLLNGLICEARARAKQSLLRRSWPLQSDREIPGSRQNLETKV